MDGRTALMFSRSRHGRGITDRARRQQAVLLGLRDRLVQLGVDGTRQLLPELQRVVLHEMRAVDLLRLLGALARVQRTQIHGLVLQWDHTAPRVLPDGRWVMLPRADAIAAAVRGLFSAGTPGYLPPAACKPVNAAFEHRKRMAKKSPAR